jgi:hypothetical protein
MFNPCLCAVDETHPWEAEPGSGTINPGGRFNAKSTPMTGVTLQAVDIAVV